MGAGAVYGGCCGRGDEMVSRSARPLCGSGRRLLGFGTALNDQPVAYLIEHNGYRSAFIIFGALQGLAVLISAQFLRMPPAGWLPEGWEKIKTRVHKKVQQSIRDYTPAECCAADHFYLLYMMMDVGDGQRTMLTAQLKPIGTTMAMTSTRCLVVNSADADLILNQVLNGSRGRSLAGFRIESDATTLWRFVFVMEAITITILTLVVAHPFWFIAIPD
jgi:hypothetical protein